MSWQGTQSVCSMGGGSEAELSSWANYCAYCNSVRTGSAPIRAVLSDQTSPHQDMVSCATSGQVRLPPFSMHPDIAFVLS